MNLNSLSPAPGSKKKAKRVARGIGSGSGKTAGRGHKGQKARKGGNIKPGFEGGQQPLQRRLPKYGFSSLKAKTTEEVRVDEIAKKDFDVVDIETLKKAKLIKKTAKKVKIIAGKSIEKRMTIKGNELYTTKGSRAAIEAAGGNILSN